MIAPAETTALREALDGMSGRAAQSLQADLAVVADRTAAYFASLRHPERLPSAGDGVEQDGGVYLHATRPLIVYCLEQPGLDPLREAAPPYHRLLVGARTIHEWGHLSEDAGWLGVPPELQARHREAQAEVVAAIDALLAAAPEAFAAAAHEEAHAADRSPGRLVCDIIMGRMPDFTSNRLAARYLGPEELQAYVRANVYTHFGEEARPLHLLARSAYELQYLVLASIDDPARYLLRSTWLHDFFVETGLVSLEHLRALWDATGQLCDVYRVDESAFVPAAPAEA